MTGMQAWPHRNGQPDRSETLLDQARIASMADEGGQAGATRDLQEQFADVHGAASGGYRQRVADPRVELLAIGVIAGAVGFVAGSLFARRRQGASR